MRKTRHHRRNFRNRSRKQRGGHDNGYDKAASDWVTKILLTTYFSNWTSHQNEEFPKVTIESDAMEGEFEEIARHIRFLMSNISNPGGFNQMLVSRKNDSTFQISIDYMIVIENYLRAQAVPLMSPVTSLTDQKTYPLIIWALLASAPDGPIRPILEEPPPSAPVLQ